MTTKDQNNAHDDSNCDKLILRQQFTIIMGRTVHEPFPSPNLDFQIKAEQELTLADDIIGTFMCTKYLILECCRSDAL